MNKLFIRLAFFFAILGLVLIAGTASSPAPKPPASGGTKTSGSASKTSGTASSSSSSRASGSGGSSGGGKTFDDGIASYYTEWKSAAGSCGAIPPDGDIAAVNANVRQCGKCINIDYNGKKLKVKITDTCPSCPENKIDLSDVAFKKLDSLDKGLLKIKWSVVDC